MAERRPGDRLSGVHDFRPQQPVRDPHGTQQPRLHDRQLHRPGPVDRRHRAGQQHGRSPRGRHRLLGRVVGPILQRPGSHQRRLLQRRRAGQRTDLGRVVRQTLQRLHRRKRVRLAARSRCVHRRMRATRRQQAEGRLSGYRRQSELPRYQYQPRHQPAHPLHASPRPDHRHQRLRRRGARADDPTDADPADAKQRLRNRDGDPRGLWLDHHPL